MADFEGRAIGNGEAISDLRGVEVFHETGCLAVVVLGEVRPERVSDDLAIPSTLSCEPAWKE